MNVGSCVIVTEVGTGTRTGLFVAGAFDVVVTMGLGTVGCPVRVPSLGVQVGEFGIGTTGLGSSLLGRTDRTELGTVVGPWVCRNDGELDTGENTGVPRIGAVFGVLDSGLSVGKTVVRTVVGARFGLVVLGVIGNLAGGAGI